MQQNELTRDDFVRGARVIAGDQVLVQTIQLMQQKVRRIQLLESISGVSLVEV